MLVGMRREAITLDLIRASTRGMRLKRMHQFLSIMKPSSEEIILDVGGSPDLWDICGYRGQVVLLNLEDPEIYGPMPPNCRYVRGDARCVDFPDKSFDIVFSNSVLEHVGSWEDQKAFARETSRIGRRYWIQTPNKNFPIEPHWNFPLFHFLPISMREWIAVRWPLSFIKKNEGRNSNSKELRGFVQSIRLLNERELLILYPDGRLWRERLFGLVKSIVVYRC